MIRLLYNLLWPLGLLFFLPRYVRKMFRRGGYRRNFGQRFGWYSGEVRSRLRDSQPVWLHAVSVGEVNVALKLADELHDAEPGLRIVLTTTTTTGYTLAERSAPEHTSVLYAPLDFWPIMRTAFRTISPQKVVLIEGELWPNLLSEASRRRLPVVLANARLSGRSERRFRRFKFVVAPLFRHLNMVCVPTEQDAARWSRLGVAPARTKVVGNIKYDPRQNDQSPVEPRNVLDTIGVARDRPILLGGSTHVGEEELLADVFCRLRQHFRNLFLIIAPRHVERVRQVEAQLRSHGLRVSRRSVRSSAPVDVLLIDTTGELPHWYAVATLAFIGKSFTIHGGQNPVEPILARVPVIFGPHMDNFRSLAADLIAAGAAFCVNTQQQLLAECERLLADPALRDEMIATALRVIAPHRGATSRTANLIAHIGASQHPVKVG